MITLGSLFDGIAGFPLAALRLNIVPLWASEIECFCIKVSKARFPDMKHHGDIIRINGAEIEPVDIITAGSPCQDLSVAGKRAGLAGRRSGLFMEQNRIIKEMRSNDKTNGRTGINIRPRFMVWENVPGAFSSNKGEDFRAVLEETARIADETAIIPQPQSNRWNSAGLVIGNGFSIGWRVLDAQYWGVPQRRRRIFLVADFGGQSAPEILFKREGLSRNLAEGGEARERIARGIEGSTDMPIWGISDRRRVLESINVLPSLSFKMGTDSKSIPIIPAYCLQGSMIGRADENGPHGDGINEEISFTLTATDTHAVAVRTANTGANGHGIADNVAHTLDRANGQAVCAGFNGWKSITVSIQDQEGRSPTIETNIPGNIINCTSKGIAGTVSRKWAKGTGGPAGDEHYNLIVTGLNCRNGEENGDLCGTLQAKQNGEFSYNCIHPVGIKHIVRRLTPLECERLQNFPDGWTMFSTKYTECSDSARYKALGNSVAVCCPEYVLEGIVEIINNQLRP